MGADREGILDRGASQLVRECGIQAKNARTETNLGRTSTSSYRERPSHTQHAIRTRMDALRTLATDALLFAIACLVLWPFAAVALHVIRVRDRLRARASSSPHIGVVSLSPGTHSPRAISHALALKASKEYSVCVHAIAPVSTTIIDHDITFIPIPVNANSSSSSTSSSQPSSSLSSTLIRHTIALYQSLITSKQLSKYDVIIVNTPPCIPTFLIILLAARIFHSASIIIDWHNFAYTIMETNGKSKFLVRIAYNVEWIFGRTMDAHFCVSKAMSTYLANQWGIDAHVVYDRPTAMFQRVLDPVDIHVAFMTLQQCAQFIDLSKTKRQDQCHDHQHHITDTIATTIRTSDQVPILKPDRPAVLITSTSWTADEDFGILFDALDRLDRRLRNTTDNESARTPFHGRLLCVITGRGPLRAAFEDKVARAAWTRVAVWFAWLPQDVYPVLLGCADAGVSLHTSSSGLDLPMKVVDMLGSGLPVLAYQYRCIHELVIAGRTGLLFYTAEDLADAAFRLLFSADAEALRTEMSRHVQASFARPEMRWQAGWERDAMPVVARLCGQKAA